tara:strand:- start:5941 stop:6255 length:315 start_codon:yes stop_codon:yes gene_type:complete
MLIDGGRDDNTAHGLKEGLETLSKRRCSFEDYFWVGQEVTILAPEKMQDIYPGGLFSGISGADMTHRRNPIALQPHRSRFRLIKHLFSDLILVLRNIGLVAIQP